MGSSSIPGSSGARRIGITGGMLDGGAVGMSCRCRNNGVAATGEDSDGGGDGVAGTAGEGAGTAAAVGAGGGSTGGAAGELSCAAGAVISAGGSRGGRRGAAPTSLP